MLGPSLDLFSRSDTPQRDYRRERKAISKTEWSNDVGSVKHILRQTGPFTPKGSGLRLACLKPSSTTTARS